LTKDERDYFYTYGKWGSQININNESILLEELDPA